MNDSANTHDPRHPHQRDGRDEAPVLDGEGRCLVCGRDLLDETRIALDQVKGERDRYRAALDELDNLNPADFKGGQSHLSAAFREVDFRGVFRRVCRVVNGVLHDADENGRPISRVSVQAAGSVREQETPQ